MPTSSLAVLWEEGLGWVLGWIAGVNINIARCPGLVYTCQYNPNITNIIIFWQIHLEMSRGRRIFINDNSHMARPGQCVVVSLMTVSGQDGQQSSCVRLVGKHSGRLLRGSDRSLYKKRWLGRKIFYTISDCMQSDHTSLSNASL